ncbi:DUF3108 domain-containing protein [Amycolatopsis sp.]|uniref:DUF3108 domain-containing protein n=1 Tax=Amycolatopsis sp. TaxID=37632 RepID=UPI00262F40B4|nr:DUF3108 domain-containing protein [Amycolatopsis sp.]
MGEPVDPVAQPFRDPEIPDGEETGYQASVGKDERYHVVSRVERLGETHYRHSINADLAELELAVKQIFVRAKGFLAAESYCAETTHEGKVVSREEGYFRGTKHLQFGGQVKPFPGDVMPLLGGMVALRGLDFARGSKRTVDLWLAFSVFWQLEVRVERRETVRVPAGHLDAWRVRVRPSFSQISSLLDKVIGGLLPPFTLHFEAAAPHRMLRFEFPTGPLPWNPRGLVEATKLD